MPATKTKYDEEVNNVFALDRKDEPIHISDAESGKKGYFCMGCKREMQAVLTKITGRKIFFRHDVIKEIGKAKCTFSDETYRHKIAKEILERLKTIKVPSVYKYPPTGQEGLANLLSEAKLIETHSVAIERVFYEDENGLIHWQKKNIPLDGKHLLIKPDVAFFDKDEKPILLIEIVATHKVSDDKKVKLKRLGIDTVQIHIPKHFSPKEIEESFFKTQYIKWIYNDEEQRTQYISISDGGSEGIPSVDEEQRKLFTESFACKSAEIKNLIQTINRCLESKQFGEIERGLKSELYRVAGNTEKLRREWARLQEEISNGVEEEFRERRGKFEREEREFFNSSREFQSYSKDLERRYFGKREILESKITRAIEGIGGNAKPFETQRRNLEREATVVDGDIRDGERRIEQIKRDREQLETKIRSDFESAEQFERREIERIQSTINGLSGRFEKEESGLRTEFEYFEERERRENEDCEKFENEYGSIVEEGRRELEERYKSIREGIIESIKNRVDRGDTEFTRKLKEVIKNGAFLKHLGEAQELNRRNRKAWECFKEGTYRKWIK